MGVRAWCLTAGLALGVIVTVPPAGPLQARSVSPPRSLAGNYGIVFVVQSVATLRQESGIGVAVLHGDGTVTGVETFNTGTQTCEVTLTGTYTLEANGTGRMRLGSVSPIPACSFTANLAFVVFEGGNLLRMISTDPGFVVLTEEWRRRPEY
jgi:hypothetical protein